jgi:hypothetical protein
MARATRAHGAALAAAAAVVALLVSACAAVSPPGDDPSSSGFIKVPNTHDTHLFYWWFQSRSTPDTDPLVLVRLPRRCARWRCCGAPAARWRPGRRDVASRSARAQSQRRTL